MEYVSSALVDLEFHSLASAENLDVRAFERAALSRIGMPEEIVMRHRPPHFQHVFSGGGYAAAYYSYMWSEVLDADAFAAFEEAGDIFDPATARKLRDNIYAAGGSREPEAAYIAFRGRLPTPDALLARRGLVDAAPSGRRDRRDLASHCASFFLPERGRVGRGRCCAEATPTRLVRSTAMLHGVFRTALRRLPLSGEAKRECNRACCALI